MQTDQQQPKQEVPRQKQHSTSMEDLEKIISILTNAVNRQGVKIARLERQIAKLTGQKSAAKTSSSQSSRQFSAPKVRVRASKLEDFLDNVLIQAQKANNQQILPSLRFGAAEKFPISPGRAKSRRNRPKNQQKARSHTQGAQIADWVAWNRGSARNYLRNYRAPVFKHPNKMLQHNRNDLAKSYARQTRLAGWYQEHDNKKGLKRANRLRSRFAKKLTRADANFMQRKHADDEIIRIAGAKGGKVMLSASAKQKISQNRNTTASLEDIFAQILLAQLEKLAKSNSKRKHNSKITQDKLDRMEQSAKKINKDLLKDSKPKKKKPQDDPQKPRQKTQEQQLADTKAALEQSKQTLQNTQKALDDMQTKVAETLALCSQITAAAESISKAAGRSLKSLKTRTANLEKQVNLLWLEVDA